MRHSRGLRLVLPGLVGLGLLGMAACGGGNVPVEDEAGIANPASVHCEEQGGAVVIVETDDEQVGICVLDDGRECEEWAYYERGVCVSGADQATATATVELYFSNETLGDPCGEVFPVPREVPADTLAVEAVEALLAGPTPDEEAQGYGGWFSADTEGLLRSVGVTDGTVRVDFADLRPVIPNASTSCGSAALLAQLDRTLLQFPDIDATLYSIDGSPEVFYEWLQYEAPAG
jgi:putative hemolysin